MATSLNETEGNDDRFPRCFTVENRLWLGAESNRRHVDFQSTALPTELPSRDWRRGCAAPVGFSLCRNVVVGQALPLSSGGGRRPCPTKCCERPSLCLLEFKLQSAT